MMYLQHVLTAKKNEPAYLNSAASLNLLTALLQLCGLNFYYLYLFSYTLVVLIFMPLP